MALRDGAQAAFHKTFSELVLSTVFPPTLQRRSCEAAVARSKVQEDMRALLDALPAGYKENALPDRATPVEASSLGEKLAAVGDVRGPCRFGSSFRCTRSLWP